jgi:hypothetical protein
MNYEYKVVVRDAGDHPQDFAELQRQAAEFEALLNALGQEGWEIKDAGNGIFVFMRVKPARTRGPLGNV